MKYIYLLGLALLCLSCQKDQDNKEAYEKLEKKYDSLTKRVEKDNDLIIRWSNQRVAVDSLLNTIEELRDSVAQGLFPKDQLEEKVKTIQVLIDEKNGIIDKLEEELTQEQQTAKAYAVYTKKEQDSLKVELLKQVEQNNLFDNVKFVLQSEINRYKKELAIQEELIKGLNNQVKGLEGQVDDLTSQRDKLNITVSSTSQDLAAANTLLEEKRKELEAYEQKLIATQQKATRNLNSQKMRMAQSLIDAVRSVPGAGRKKKLALINDAWDLLCELHQDGVYQAMDKMNELRNDKVLKKFVAGKECIR